MLCPRTSSQKPDSSQLVLLIPFIAFCVMIGLHWSLKSKGTLGSVVGTVAVVFITSGNPRTLRLGIRRRHARHRPSTRNTLASKHARRDSSPPSTRLDETVNTERRPGSPPPATSMAIGALVSAAIYIAIVYAVLTALVRNFDFTVRKLAGS